MTQTSYLRCRDVLALAGIARSTLYARISDSAAPRPVRVGPEGSRAVRWRSSDVQAWLSAPDTYKAPALAA